MQALDEPNVKNTNEPRTLDCLFLRPNAIKQDGCELLHLPANKIIIRRKIWSVLVTKSVIAQVEAIAKREDRPKGLKIKNENGAALFDNS